MNSDAAGLQDESHPSPPPRTRYEFVLLAVVAVAVFCSRLPFIGNGYGRDPDAWRLIKSAHQIATGGVYEASRLPGYPVPEFAYAALGAAPRLWLVSVVVLSTISTILFARILARAGCRDALWGALAFALTPVIYINSTSTMDYMWALTFVLGALYAAMTPRPLTAGILAGVAIACRMSSVVMLAPLAIILVRRLPADRSAWWHTLRMLAAAVATAVVAYIPVAMKYGNGMFNFVDDTTSVGRVLDLAGPGVWGRVGVPFVLAMVLLGIVLVATRKRTRDRIAGPVRGYLVAGLVAIALQFLVFLRLPGEAAYLVVVVPMLLLVLALIIPRWAFIALCVSLAASSFLDVRTSGIFPGPVLQDRYARRIYLDDSHVILRSVDKLEGDNLVVVSGWLTPQLETMRTLLNIPDRSRQITFAREFQNEKGGDVYLVPVASLFPPGDHERWMASGARPLPIR